MNKSLLLFCLANSVSLGLYGADRSVTGADIITLLTNPRSRQYVADENQLKRMIEAYKIGKVDFTEPDENGLSGMMNAAIGAVETGNLMPVRVLLDTQISPFIPSTIKTKKRTPFDIVNEVILDQPHAFKVLQLMGRHAQTLPEAASALIPGRVDILANKTTINQLDSYGHNALECVIINGTKLTQGEKSIEHAIAIAQIISCLVATGMDPNGKMPKQRHPIFGDAEEAKSTYMHLATSLALQHKTTVVLKALLNNGGCPEAKGQSMFQQIHSPYSFAKSYIRAGVNSAQRIVDLFDEYRAGKKAIVK